MAIRPYKYIRFDSDIHHRRSIRLPGYDYSHIGVYFITICTKDREYLFGKIIDGEMRLNEYGKIVYDEWLKSTVIRREIKLDKFVIMPNHFHGVIIIDCEIGRSIHPVGAYGHTPLRSPSKTIGAMIRGFKSSVTKQINILRAYRNVFQQPVWQRNYYEHIIRNEESLEKIREYIVNNPLNWGQDEMNLQKL